MVIECKKVNNWSSARADLCLIISELVLKLRKWLVIKLPDEKQSAIIDGKEFRFQSAMGLPRYAYAVVIYNL